MAIGTTGVFCSAPGNGAVDACSSGTPAADGCVYITDNPSASCPDPNSGESRTFFFLDRQVTMVDTFEGHAGEHTSFLRGSNTGDDRPGELLFNRRQLTVVFIPDASTP